MATWERLSDQARDVILLAREEACALKHNEIGVEHVLLGLVLQNEGLAARTLRSFDLNADRLRELAVARVAPRNGPGPGEVPLTQDALDAILDRGLAEALPLGGEIAPEHMLLGLVDEDDAPGARVLSELGVHPQRVRTGVLTLISPPPAAPPDRREPPKTGVDPQVAPRFTDAAREAIAFAEDEARNLKHTHICTEHLLLGLLRVGGSVAARALKSCGITLERVRAQIEATGRERAAGHHCSLETPEGELPISAHARRGLARAAKKSESGDQIDTEHILLGIIGVHESFGTRMLIDLGVYLEGIRDVVVQTVDNGQPPANAEELAKAAPSLPLERHVTWGYMEATTEAHHTAQLRGDTHASLDDLVTGALLVDEGWPTGKGARDGLLEGAWPLAGPLLREIEDRLGRPLDAGDLLILLASVAGGVAASALSSLGVAPDVLSQAVDEARRDGARSELLWPPELVARSDESRAARERSEVERLAERREQTELARRSVEQRRADLLQVLRKRLGLSSQ